MKVKKWLAGCLAAAMLCSVFAGCTATKNGSGTSEDGKIHIKIGGLLTERSEKNAKEYDLQQANIDSFQEKYPDVVIEPVAWSQDLRNYLVKAASGDLPTMYHTSPTELNTIVKNGYAKDITSIIKKLGYDKKLDDKYSNLYMVNNKYYALPRDNSVYTMGLLYNIDLFKQAGLLDENGVPMYPQTWEELAQTAKTIKDKTGKYGFALPSTKNQGGWFFMNILWSYGAEMMEEKDGRYTATFATDAGVKALEFVKDLKWKYNVLPESSLPDLTTLEQSFAVGDIAMMFEIYSQLDSCVDKYDLDVTNVAMSKLPAGPADRCAQVGGGIWMFSGTDEENEACLRWLEHIGQGPDLTDDVKAKWEKNYALKKEKGRAVGVAPVSMWKDTEKVAAELDVIEKHKTVDAKFFNDFTDAEGVTLKHEPPMCAQQLYSCLDNAIQRVWTDKNADCKKILEETQKDFQVNYLDKEDVVQ